MARSSTLVAPLAALALTFTAMAARAQNSPLPQCEHLKYGSDFRLNGAELHFNQAEQTQYPDDRANQLKDVFRLLGEVAQHHAGDPATLWFLYGRAYALNHDLVGADSAWSKAEALTDADCKATMERLRHNAWVPIYNDGVEAMNAQHLDSALALFREANGIYRTSPTAFYNMAMIFVQQSSAATTPEAVTALTDSAVKYFRAAADASTDPRFADARETALFNAARLLHREALDSGSVHAEATRKGVPDSAVSNARLRAALAAYQDALAVKPHDLTAQASVAGLLTALGREAAARAVYDTMLAHSDSVDAADLFDAGAALVRTERYDLGARFIERGLSKNKCDRDALFNLANAYMGAKDSVRMLATAKQLVAQDSMHRSSLQLLARAYQDNGLKDSTLNVLLRADSMPWEITELDFSTTDTSASVHAIVTNLQSQIIKGFPLSIVFMDGTCQPVATKQVLLPDLNASGSPGQAYDFTVTASGRGIAAWKYQTN